MAEGRTAARPATPAFDLVIRGGTLVDGTGRPGRPADVGVRGDRVTAVGDLSAVDATTVGLLLEIPGRVVAPGFVDPHGHSDGSILLDGALASHLHQGYTTQLQGNCGLSFAPVTDIGLDGLAVDLGTYGLEATWRTFAEYLELIEAQPLGPNAAFLVGHGTLRGAVLGPDSREPEPDELRTMVRLLEEALEAGAVGMSSGLIYAPGMHARPAEIERLVRATARRGGLYATHMRNETDGLFDSLAESVAAVRAAGEGARLQVSHLKAGAQPVWGRAAEAVAFLEAARREGLDVAADQYPYTAAATTLQTILPPSVLALPTDEIVAALRNRGARRRIRAEIDRGVSGWENVAQHPGWEGIRISWAASRPEWAGRSVAEIADETGHDPFDVALDALAEDRLDVSIVIECMDPDDVATIAAVPWIAVCTDAEGRRPGHPILDAGVPHPRTYGSTARVLGELVRERAVLDLPTAVAKLSSVPAARVGLIDRGIVRKGWAADLVVFDPATVADLATYDVPVAYPAGIEHVIVNGVAAVLDGQETGARPGRLLRRAS
jgi:N-acyl-D-amino-acid deacylase